MIFQRDFLTRNRRRIALLAVLSAIVLAVAFEHAGIGHGGMTDMDADPGAGDVVVMCLAVMGLGGILGAAVAGVRTGQPRLALDLLPALRLGVPHRAAIPFPARAGPERLQVFRR